MQLSDINILYKIAEAHRSIFDYLTERKSHSYAAMFIGFCFILLLTFFSIKDLPPSPRSDEVNGNGIYPFEEWSLGTLIVVVYLFLILPASSQLQARNILAKQTLKIPLISYVTNILSICGISLGDEFRLNLMRPRDPLEAGIKEFGFVAKYNLEIKEINDKITGESPGVGDALISKNVVYLSADKLDKSIDAKCKHLWSKRLPNTEYVLNIDKTITEISDDEIAKIKIVAEDIAGDFKHLKLDPLPILKRGE